MVAHKNLPRTVRILMGLLISRKQFSHPPRGGGGEAADRRVAYNSLARRRRHRNHIIEKPSATNPPFSYGQGGRATISFYQHLPARLCPRRRG